MDIEQLNIKYGIADQLKLVKDRWLPFILISNAALQLDFVYAARCFHSSLLKNVKTFYFSAKIILVGQSYQRQTYAALVWIDPRFKRPNHGFVRNGLWAVSGTEATTDLKQSKVEIPGTPKAKVVGRSIALELEISVGNTSPWN
jgi:hypothetical protein